MGSAAKRVRKGKDVAEGSAGFGAESGRTPAHSDGVGSTRIGPLRSLPHVLVVVVAVGQREDQNRNLDEGGQPG